MNYGDPMPRRKLQVVGTVQLTDEDLRDAVRQFLHARGILCVRGIEFCHEAEDQRGEVFRYSAKVTTPWPPDDDLPRAESLSSLKAHDR